MERKYGARVSWKRLVERRYQELYRGGCSSRLPVSTMNYWVKGH